jgi:NADPH:quinone reductase-like Zn-dependent oxidoreductase
MKAARIHRFGGPEVIQIDDVPIPDPGHGEILVQVKAAGVNFFDAEIREGAIPTLSLPHTLGMDGAGVVTAVGPSVDPSRIGQQVVFHADLGCGDCVACITGHENRCETMRLIGVQVPGTYAEHITVPAINAIPFRGLSFQEAACLDIPFTTAWHLLVEKAQLKPGQTVLVVGASGDVGLAAVQIARLAGARVLATTSSAEKAARLSELGAEAVFDYREGDPWQEVRRHTGDRGVDFVVDYTGTNTLTHSMGALAKGGAVLIVGCVTGGPIPDFNVRPLYARHLSLIGSSSGTRADLRAVLGEVEQGRLRPVLSQEFPLAAASEVHQLAHSGTKTGSLVLIP